MPDRQRRARSRPTAGRSGGTFAEHWHLFRGTPSRLWLEQTFAEVFGVDHRRSARTPPTRSTTRSPQRLAEPEFRPRALFERFNIEVLATTESPLDDLARHAKLAADGWGGPGGRVITTFRPDDVVDMEWDGWADRVAQLGELTGADTRPSPASWPRCGSAGRRSSPPAPPPPTTATRPRVRSILDPADAAALFRRGLRRRGRAPRTPRRSGPTCSSSSPGCRSRTAW